MKRSDYAGFFFDDPLADCACILAVAIAAFALLLLIPGPAPGASAWVALVLPTRRPLRVRLVARIRATYLRWRIWHAERDLADHQAELDNALTYWPRQIEVDRMAIDAMTRELARTANDF